VPADLAGEFAREAQVRVAEDLELVRGAGPAEDTAVVPEAAPGAGLAADQADQADGEAPA
jgi:hypothetical protein